MCKIKNNSARTSHATKILTSSKIFSNFTTKFEPSKWLTKELWESKGLTGTYIESEKAYLGLKGLTNIGQTSCRPNGVHGG